MAIVETTQDVPLTLTPDGSIKITGSRVSLDSLIYHYRHGATAEEIAIRFAGLRLADIHACICLLPESPGRGRQLSHRKRERGGQTA